MESQPTLRASAGSAPAPISTRSRVLGLLAGLVLGAVWLVAAYGKILDPVRFVEVIQQEKLDFLLPALAVALIAIALEVGLGVALVIGERSRWVLWPSAALVAFFLFLTGRNWWAVSQGLKEPGSDCGCFGNLVQRTPAEAFWQDALLMVPALLVLLVVGARRPSLLKLGLATAAALAATIFAFLAPTLPLDDLATRLKPGVETADLCIQGAEPDAPPICMDYLVPELAQGEHWVVIADLEAEETGEITTRLNDHLLAGAGPSLWMLSAATPEVKNEFFWSWGPVFEIREAPEPLLRSLYRELPRTFRVVDGTVRETWSGLPPLQSPPPEEPRLPDEPAPSESVLSPAATSEDDSPA